MDCVLSKTDCYKFVLDWEKCLISRNGDFLLHEKDTKTDATIFDHKRFVGQSDVHFKGVRIDSNPSLMGIWCSSKGFILILSESEMNGGTAIGKSDFCYVLLSKWGEIIEVEDLQISRLDVVMIFFDVDFLALTINLTHCDWCLKVKN